jgi:hypothetical protein
MKTILTSCVRIIHVENITVIRNSSHMYTDFILLHVSAHRAIITQKVTEGLPCKISFIFYNVFGLRSKRNKYLFTNSNFLTEEAVLGWGQMSRK